VNITLLQNIIYQGFAAFFFYNMRTLGAIGSMKGLNEQEMKNLNKKNRHYNT